MGKINFFLLIIYTEHKILQEQLMFYFCHFIFIKKQLQNLKLVSRWESEEITKIDLRK